MAHGTWKTTGGSGGGPVLTGVVAAVVLLAAGFAITGQHAVWQAASEVLMITLAIVAAFVVLIVAAVVAMILYYRRQGKARAVAWQARVAEPRTVRPVPVTESAPQALPAPHQVNIIFDPAFLANLASQRPDQPVPVVTAISAPESDESRRLR